MISKVIKCLENAKGNLLTTFENSLNLPKIQQSYIMLTIHQNLLQKIPEFHPKVRFIF